MIEPLAGKPPPYYCGAQTGQSVEIAPELQYFQAAVTFAATGQMCGKRKRIRLRQARREVLFENHVAGMGGI